MDKPLQIVFRDMDRSDFLAGLIEDRVERLERFYPQIVSCRVVVEVPHRGSETGKPPIGVAVEVGVPGRDTIVAKGEEERREAKGDTTTVVNRVFDAVQRQLETTVEVNKGKVKMHESAGETGAIARIFADRGYGFIEMKGSPELFFSRNAVVGDFDTLEAGTLVHVTRAAAEGPMGPQASSVRILGAE